MAKLLCLFLQLSEIIPCILYIVFEVAFFALVVCINTCSMSTDFYNNRIKIIVFDQEQQELHIYKKFSIRESPTMMKC